MTCGNKTLNLEDYKKNEKNYNHFYRTFNTFRLFLS